MNVCILCSSGRLWIKKSKINIMKCHKKLVSSIRRCILDGPPGITIPIEKGRKEGKLCELVRYLGGLVSTEKGLPGNVIGFLYSLIQYLSVNIFSQEATQTPDQVVKLVKFTLATFKNLIMYNSNISLVNSTNPCKMWLRRVVF